jgi:ankyrin repeat protein
MSTEQVMSQEELDELYIQAVAAGEIDVVDQLLSQGANKNAQTPKGNSPLILAFNKNKFAMFNHLLDIGVNVDTQDMNQETVLMLIVKKEKKLNYLEALLDYSPNLDLQNNHKSTALHLACMFKNVEAAQTLINEGANVLLKTVQKTTPLLAAAQNGSFTIVQLLIDKGADVHDLDHYGKDVLMSAVAQPEIKKEEVESYFKICQKIIEQDANVVNYVAPGGITSIFMGSMYQRTDIVKLLLENGANPNVNHSYSTISKITPLHFATQAKNLEMATALLEKGADLNVPNSEGNTPGTFAFLAKELRGLALQYGADVDSLLYQEDANKKKFKYPVLASVIVGADEETFDAMLAKGVTLNYTDKELQPFQPVKLAIQLGLSSIFNKILDATKIKLDELWTIEDGKELSPLMILVKDISSQKLDAIIKQKNMLEKTLKNPDFVLEEEKKEELKQELEKLKNLETELNDNKKQMLSRFIKEGANLNFTDKEGNTALFHANNKEYVQTLIDNGADVFHKNDDGDIPLAYAIKNGKTEVADILLAHIIEHDDPTRDEIKYLLLDMIYSAPEGYYQQQLFMRGLDYIYQAGSGSINVQDDDGNNPLIVAAATNQGSVCGLLIDKGAEINLANNAGETALMHAIGQNNPELVAFLIDKGADVTAKTVDGKTVMDFVEELENKEIYAKVMKKIDPDFDEQKASNVRKFKA